MGSVAAEPSKWLSQDQYWFCESGASTSTTEDGEPVVITSRTLDAGETIAYCTFNTAQTQKVESDEVDEEGFPIEVDTLVFNSTDILDPIPDGSGYFVRMKARFTPREKPKVSAISDFPYRTLLYVKDEGEGNPSHLAFLERKEGEVAAQEVVTDCVVDTEDPFFDITVQLLKNKTFRVYVGESEVTVGGSARPYRSLQNGEGGHYYAEHLHSFAFTGSVELTDIAFTTTKPSWFPESVDSVPFSFVYDSAAIYNVSELPTELSKRASCEITFTADTDQYVLGVPVITGNSLSSTATLSLVDSESKSYKIAFTVADTLTDDNPLVLTLPSKAYFFKLNGKEYGTFSEIIEAASKSEDKTITITHDINLDAPISPGAQAVIGDSQEIILDLKGKKIKGGVSRPEADDAAILNRGKLKIIDSVGGGIIEANGVTLSTGNTLALEGDRDTLALENDANETIIKAGIFNGVVTNVAGRIQIDGGKFYNMFNQNDTKEDPFYLRTQKGIDISAKFTAAVIKDNYWQAPSVEEGKVLIEYRPDHGSAVPAVEILSKEEADKLTSESVKEKKINVKAPGYDVSTIEWAKEKGDDTIWHGAMTALVYTVTYELGGKGAFESEPKTEFTIEDPILSLPEPVDDRGLWELDCWLLDGEEVRSLGDTELTLNNLKLKLVAKWKPIEQVWTNAMKGSRYLAMSEANGYFADETSWQIAIPVSDAFENGDSITLKSITLSTVNAAPKNLERMAPRLCLTINGVQHFATAALKKNSSTEFEYFDTNYGYRPKIVYSFDEPPTILAASSYTFTLVEDENTSYHPVLLRLVKKTGDTEFQMIGTVGTVPSAEYKTYVPMYEIKGEAK